VGGSKFNPILEGGEGRKKEVRRKERRKERSKEERKEGKKGER
jgi:hypothetical protein